MGVNTLAFGAVYALLFVYLGPFVAVIWLVAGVAVAIARAVAVTPRRTCFFLIGLVFGAVPLVMVHHDCENGLSFHCQEPSLASTWGWYVICLAAAGLGGIVLWLTNNIRGRQRS